MKRTYTLITGATSGIGKAIAIKLHKEGHHLILGNRNRGKAAKLKKELLQMGSESPIDFFDCDLSSFSSIKDFCKRVKEKYEYIDVLINNAGLLTKKNDFTKDGFQMTVGTNYLGTYLLTELLLEKLEKSKNPKIIFTTSIIAKFAKCRISRDFFINTKKGIKAYANSKLSLLMYASELKKRLKDKNFIIKAVHPGIIYTHIFKWRNAFGEWIGGVQKLFMKNSEQGSRIQVEIASTDKYDKEEHLYYSQTKKLKMPKQVLNDLFRNRFINFTNELIRNNENL